MSQSNPFGAGSPIQGHKLINRRTTFYQWKPALSHMLWHCPEVKDPDGHGGTGNTLLLHSGPAAVTSMLQPWRAAELQPRIASTEGIRGACVEEKSNSLTFIAPLLSHFLLVSNISHFYMIYGVFSWAGTTPGGLSGFVYIFLLSQQHHCHLQLAGLPSQDKLPFDSFHSAHNFPSPPLRLSFSLLWVTWFLPEKLFV